MDPHKLTRGMLLDAWVKSHGGAVACLTAAGYERGTAAFRARESYLSQCRRIGMGHPAALRFEKEFEPAGMAPGTLTNNLDGIGSRRDIDELVIHSPYVTYRDAESASPPNTLGHSADHVRSADSSVKTLRKLPLVRWGATGADVVSGAVQANGELTVPVRMSDGTVFWQVEDDAMSPDYNPGDFVAVDFDAGSIQSVMPGEAVIVATPSGSHLLRYYTPLAEGHFEARPPSSSRYGSISTLQMALKIKAVVVAHLKVRRRVDAPAPITSPA